MESLKKIAKLGLIILVLNQENLAQVRLPIPDTLSGDTIYLNLNNGHQTFIPGITTNTMGANGDILGPTLILRKGELVHMFVKNNLGEPTTIHWHGLHVASENDGGPHTPIGEGETWSPSFTVLDHAATFWYHPHLHHKTNEHVSKGIAGMIIVRDDNEGKLPLPRTYGIDDIPLILQTKEIDAQGQITTHTNQDRLLLVNGAQNTEIDLPAQWVRFRVLNGSSQRSFFLGFDDNRPFYQIASDAALLNMPVEMSRLLISPGERAEIMVNFDNDFGQQRKIKSFASELPNGIYGARFPGMGQGMTINGYNPNSLNGSDFDLLAINVINPISGNITKLPQTLNNLERYRTIETDTSRNFTFMPEQMGPNQLNGHFMINNLIFDMDYINEIVPLNNTEVWNLNNQSGIAHPFHLHNVPFYIVDRNGILPPANEMGLKDVVLVRPGERVRIITKFTDFSDSPVPYMYHCHLLSHEDDGMMGQFLVVSRTTGINLEAVGSPSELDIFPNPAEHLINFVSKSDVKGGSILIRNNNGQLVHKGICQENWLDIRYLENGVYYLEILTNKGERFVNKFVVAK
jgi:blue copper oxidase